MPQLGVCRIEPNGLVQHHWILGVHFQRNPQWPNGPFLMKKHESLEQELGYHSTHVFRGLNSLNHPVLGAHFELQHAMICYRCMDMIGSYQPEGNHSKAESLMTFPACSPDVKIHYLGINTVASIAKSCGSRQRIPAKWVQTLVSND